MFSARTAGVCLIAACLLWRCTASRPAQRDVAARGAHNESGQGLAATLADDVERRQNGTLNWSWPWQPRPAPTPSPADLDGDGVADSAETWKVQTEEVTLEDVVPNTQKTFICWMKKSKSHKCQSGQGQKDDSCCCRPGRRWNPASESCDVNDDEESVIPRTTSSWADLTCRQKSDNLKSHMCRTGKAKEESSCCCLPGLRFNLDSEVCDKINYCDDKLTEVRQDKQKAVNMLEDMNTDKASQEELLAEMKQKLHDSGDLEEIEEEEKKNKELNEQRQKELGDMHDELDVMFESRKQLEDERDALIKEAAKYENWFKQSIDYKMELAEAVHIGHQVETQFRISKVKNRVEFNKKCVSESKGVLRSLADTKKVHEMRSKELSDASMHLGEFEKLLPGEEQLNIDVGEKIVSGEGSLDKAMKAHEANVAVRLQQEEHIQGRLSRCEAGVAEETSKLRSLKALEKRDLQVATNLVGARQAYALLVTKVVQEEEEKSIKSTFANEQIKRGFN